MALGPGLLGAKTKGDQPARELAEAPAQSPFAPASEAPPSDPFVDLSIEVVSEPASSQPPADNRRDAAKGRSQRVSEGLLELRGPPGTVPALLSPALPTFDSPQKALPQRQLEPLGGEPSQERSSSARPENAGFRLWPWILLLVSGAIAAGVWWTLKNHPDQLNYALPTPTNALESQANREGPSGPEAAPSPEPPAALTSRALEPSLPVEPTPRPAGQGGASSVPSARAEPEPSPERNPEDSGGAIQPSPRVPAPTPVAPTVPRQRSTPSQAATEPFSRSAASEALAAAALRAASCRKDGDPSGTASVTVTFAPSGRVTSATVSGPPFAGTRTGGCIASTLRTAKVPAFAGDKVTVAKTVVIR